MELIRPTNWIYNANEMRIVPRTPEERVLLDRLWEALRSRNFPEWDSVVVSMVGPEEQELRLR
jgi:hypothetical protein